MLAQNDRQNKYMNVFILCFFLVLPVFVLNTVLTTPIKLPIDSYYHISRLANLSSNKIAFLYPQNFTTLGQFGIATNVFYPGQTLQMLLWLLPKFGIVTIYKIFMYLDMVLLLFSTYICLGLIGFSNRFYRVSFSVLFALSIGISTGFIALGESIAFIGIPWLSAGLWLSSLNPRTHFTKSFLLVAFGLSIAAYSHLMTFLLLSVFTAIYFVLQILISPRRLQIFKIGFSAGILTILSTMGATIPVVMLSHLNRVKPPVISLQQFETALISGSHFFDFSNNVDAYAMIFIVIVVVFLKPRARLGIAMGTIMALLGTDLFTWSQLLKHSFLQSMQMPARLFRPGLALTLMFVFLNISLISNNDIKKFQVRWLRPIVELLTVVLVINATASLRNSLFPDVNSSGKFEIMNEKIVDNGVLQHVGSGVISLGSVNDSITRYRPFWYLMQYTDYMPKEAVLKHSLNETVLGTSIKEQSLPNHQVFDKNGKIHLTSGFNSSLKAISFKTVDSIVKGSIQLPVVGYSGLNVDVYINGKRYHPVVKNGKLTITTRMAVKSGSLITIRQHIPIFSAVANIISIVTIIGMICWLLLRRYHLSPTLKIESKN